MLTETEVKEFRYRVNAIEKLIEKKKSKTEAFGTLDGQERLDMNELLIEKAKLKELIEHGPDAADAATVAAQIQSLENSFQRWFAYIDRGYKHES